MPRTIIALYKELTDAQHVVQHLVEAGFDRQKISLIANDRSNQYSKYLRSENQTSDDDVKGGEGATFGAVVGALTGVLAGLGAIAIPGIGAALVAGPIIGGLTGAVAGAATGGIVASLVKTGVPEEDAQYYAEGIRQGGTLVVVNADDNMADQASQIMSRHNPIDIHSQGESWRKSGWKGFDANAKPLEGQTVFPVVEEQLQVGKREVEQGRVRVFQHVTETPVEEQVTLRQEKVNVERRPVNRPVTDEDQAFKETSFEVTQKSEEPIVTKQARVVEEVVIDKNVEEQTKTVRDTVRRTDVDVENVNQTDEDKKNRR